MPMGVATNFVIDGRPYVIPMAVEETSIIAAASKTAKWIREHGEIVTEVAGQNIIGQIQIAKVQDWPRLEKFIHEKRAELIKTMNENVMAGLVARGGGVNDIQLRRIERGDGHAMAVIHVYANPCDAMGANIMNQACEYLKGPVQQATGETVTMCIL